MSLWALCALSELARRVALEEKVSEEHRGRHAQHQRHQPGAPAVNQDKQNHND